MQWATFGGSILVLLIIQSSLMRRRSIPLEFVRVGLLLAGVMIIAIGLLQANLHVSGMNVSVFLCVLIEEVIGRWIFYQSRN
jgi:hypothetical protein